MIPCEYCGEFCGAKCAGAKAAHFSAIYGAGPKSFYDEVVHQGKTKKHFDSSYDPKPPFAWIPDPGFKPKIPEELQGIQPGGPCPGCGNFTWHKGWHYPTCKYHDPEHCPVPAHGTCSPKPWPKEEPVETPSEPLKKPENTKKQVTAYAAFHNINRWTAWEQTLGFMAKKIGADWMNPYKETASVPGTGLKSPSWEGILHKDHPCTCPHCEANKSASEKTSLKYKVPTAKQYLSVLDWCIGQPGSSQELAQKLSEKELFILTGHKYPEYSQDYLCQEAGAIIEEFDKKVPDEYSIELAWASKMVAKKHGTYAKVGYLSADNIADGGVIASGSIAASPGFEMIVSKYAPKDTVFVANTDSFSPTYEKLVGLKPSPAKTPGKVEKLKPGDQVVITVSEAGELIIPPGMKGMVIRK